ncbi:hypothetical protein F0562_018662 [Nyssa sinensis]|uniref:E3 ubiquitin-protein ligase RMA n=1 Tax=Nyssa sinensis TaxID=561372 RepID=A0A5J4ZEH1_9ASTE|nr:hypothetical protein F0562_018662 [Nyssa sinensis]
MMENDTRVDSIMDLDLNQEPLHPPVDSVQGLGSLSNELETNHVQLEDRIRLQVVTARAILRQRWRRAQNPPETSNVSTDNAIETMVNIVGERVHNEECSMAAQERTVESGKSCKTDGTHSIVMEMDMDVKRDASDGGSFFDCNICLEMAKEPILTCCGHLFCWACFYQLPIVYSTARECPVCKGEVLYINITPVYGNGNNSHVPEMESGLKVPPRPRAHRIESVRQQPIFRGVSHIPVAEALRRIMNGIGITGEHPQQQNLDSVSESSNMTNISASQVPTSEVLSNTDESGGSRRPHSRRFSRVLSESAASHSSISYAPNSTEILVENLESYIQDRVLQRSHEQLLSVDGIDPFTSNAAATQMEHQTVDSTAGIYSTVPLSSYSRRINVSAAVEHSENLETDTDTEINLLLPRPSSSSRRRSDIMRVSDTDNEVSREPRRRRLR